MGIGYLYLEEDDVTVGIRNLREVWQGLWLKNAERYVVWLRRWSIVPREKRETCGRFSDETPTPDPYPFQGEGKQPAGGLGSLYNDIISEI